MTTTSSTGGEATTSDTTAEGTTGASTGDSGEIECPGVVGQWVDKVFDKGDSGSLAVDRCGRVVVSSTSKGPCPGTCKVDTQLEINSGGVWTPLPADSSIEIRALGFTAKGDVLVAGSSFENGTVNAIAIRLDMEGTQTGTYKAPGGIATAVVETPTGAIVVGGGAPGGHLWLITLDADLKDSGLKQVNAEGAGSSAIDGLAVDGNRIFAIGHATGLITLDGAEIAGDGDHALVVALTTSHELLWHQSNSGRASGLSGASTLRGVVDGETSLSVAGVCDDAALGLCVEKAVVIAELDKTTGAITPWQEVIDAPKGATVDGIAAVPDGLLIAGSVGPWASLYVLFPESDGSYGDPQPIPAAPAVGTIYGVATHGQDYYVLGGLDGKGAVGPLGTPRKQDSMILLRRSI